MIPDPILALLLLPGAPPAMFSLACDVMNGEPKEDMSTSNFNDWHVLISFLRVAANKTAQVKIGRGNTVTEQMLAGSEKAAEQYLKDHAVEGETWSVVIKRTDKFSAILTVTLSVAS